MKNRLFAYGLILIFIACFSYSIRAQEIIEDPFTFEAAYLGDNVYNLSGGIKTGFCYLGMANLRLHLNVDKAGLWKGGQIYINAANTHGASPSSELLGDCLVGILGFGLNF